MNYTMGVQLFWMLGPVGTMVFICGLIEKRLALAVIGHVISILSFPSWPIHLGILAAFFCWSWRDTRLFPRSYFHIGLTLVMMLTGALTFGFLYQHPGANSEIDWARIPKFLLFVIASPLSRNKQDLALFFGPLFIVLWAYTVVKGAKFVRPEAHFLFGALTLLSAFLISYGRHHYDFDYAFGGHYLLLTVPGWALVLFESVSHIVSQKRFQAMTSILIIYIAILCGRSMWKELHNRRPNLLTARECIVEKRETSEACLPFMQDIFLNGFDEKFDLARRGREFGIFP